MPRQYAMTSRANATTATRQRILDAALDELVAVEGEPVTLQGVAARADLSLRTLYNYFPNRDALLGAAFSHHAAQSRAAVEVVALGEGTPADQLRHLISAYYGRYAAMGGRLGALLALRGFLDLDEQIRAIRAWRRQVIDRFVADAQKAGALALPAPTARALVFAMTSHATWQQLIGELPKGADGAPEVAWIALKAALFPADRVPPSTDPDDQRPQPGIKQGRRRPSAPNYGSM